MEELVTLATYQFAPQAELARVALEQEGISAFTPDANLVATNWLLANAVGYIKLQVPRSQAEAAWAILQSHPHLLSDSAIGSSDHETESITRCLSCGAELPEDSDSCPDCGWSYGTSESDVDV